MCYNSITRTLETYLQYHRHPQECTHQNNKQRNLVGKVNSLLRTCIIAQKFFKIKRSGNFLAQFDGRFFLNTVTFNNQMVPLKICFFPDHIARSFIKRFYLSNNPLKGKDRRKRSFLLKSLHQNHQIFPDLISDPQP